MGGLATTVHPQLFADLFCRVLSLLCCESVRLVSERESRRHPLNIPLIFTAGIIIDTIASKQGCNL